MADTSMQQKTMIGIFSNQGQAQQAIQQLMSVGINAQDIHVFAQDQQISQDLSSATGVMGGMGHAAESGGGFMAAIGRFFTGDEEQSSNDDLATSLGINADAAQQYEQNLSHGNILVSVKSGSSNDAQALSILQGNSAAMSSSATSGAATKASTTTTTTTQNQQVANASQLDMSADTIRVPVVEESLSANKRTQAAGEVTVNKHVVEEQVNIPVELRHEQVSVTRHAVDRAVDAGDQAFQDDAVIRVPLYEETVSVQKTAHVTGEVEINKQSVAEQHTVSDTVRREVVDVDTVGDVHANNATTTTQTSATTTEASNKRQSGK